MNILNKERLLSNFLESYESETLTEGIFEWGTDAVTVLSAVNREYKFKYSDGLTFPAFYEIADGVCGRIVNIVYNLTEDPSLHMIPIKLKVEDSIYIFDKMMNVIKSKFASIDPVVEALLNKPECAFKFIDCFGPRCFASQIHSYSEGTTSLFSDEPKPESGCYSIIKKAVLYIASAFMPEDFEWLVMYLEDRELYNLAASAAVELPEQVKTDNEYRMSTAMLDSYLYKMFEYISERYHLTPESGLSKLVVNFTSDLYDILYHAYNTYLLD